MTRRAVVAVALLFVCLTILMTWPMARHISDSAVPHDDVYFNMWRLEWFAHAMTTPGAHLFDANIFYPARDTFAFSDAMLVEDAIAAPLIWAHVEPVLVHNLVLLAAIALSGLAMYALAYRLTSSVGGAIVAGVVFAFAPYRFEHLMHLELQWAVWSPLAFLFLHRTLDTGRWRDGAATGACLALQMLSSIYYGVFLAVLVAAATVLLLAGGRRAPVADVLKALALGAAIAMIVAAAYARPYTRAQAEVGDRPVTDVLRFSALPSSYLRAPAGNWLYGGREGTGTGDERYLLPGIVPVLLALFGLLLVKPPTWSLVYLLLVALAFDLSLGLHGYAFTFLYDHSRVFHGLRAMARLGIFILLFLGVLAAHGYRVIGGAMRPAARPVFFGVVVCLMLMEYWTAVPVVPYATEPAAVYRILAAQPRGLVVEFPLPRADALPGDEAEHAYMSTFAWYPLINGYSGNYPPSYLDRLDRLSGFPDGRSVRQLRSDGVRYMVIHGSQYSTGALAAVRSRLADAGIARELGSFSDGDGAAFLYVVR